MNKQEDLFLELDALPNKIKKYCEQLDNELTESGNGYEILAKYTKKFESLGYTFEYGLDATPFNLQKLEK